jgi:hypothetical protein
MFIKLLLLCMLCGASASANADTVCMGLPTFVIWAKGRTFPYRASRERQQTIRRGYREVRLKMTPEDVVRLLGTADWAGPSPKGCVWEYDISRPGMSGFERGTFRLVWVEFNNDLRVKRVSQRRLYPQRGRKRKASQTRG